VTEGVLIDGSRGEGGGQILRTSLTLSIVTGRPFRMMRIRSGRPNPGLAAQHLACIRAAAEICGAKVGGAEGGSQDLQFVPGRVEPSEISVDVGTAGSTSLVLQTVALPLTLANGPSRVRITGGTHVPWSPVHPFLETDWVPAMEGLGLPLSVKMVKPGFYPKGGGEILALIPGNGNPKPMKRKVRSNLRNIRGRAFFSKMPRPIAERMAKDARRALRRAGVAVNVDAYDLRGELPVLGLHLTAVMHDGQSVGFSFLVEKGKAVENAAHRNVNFLFGWLDSGMAYPGYLADQLLLPLSVAREPSVFTTSRITRHLVTNAEVIQRFRPVRAEIRGKEGGPGTVTLTPA
jgi:RNA 3'-terminal phosphate cyclase (ATP)